MADEQGAGAGTNDSKREKGWERRSEDDRRKAERRTIDVPVDKDRRSGWDRRQKDRRKT